MSTPEQDVALGTSGSQKVAAAPTDGILGEIVRRLVAVYHPERIYLFGSLARGEGGPDSDYDILVIVPDAFPPEKRRSRLAYEALWGAGRSGDIVVLTSSDFASRAHVPGSLPGTVLREGKLLYAA